MLLRGSFTGPLKALTLCNHTIKWVNYARLLHVTIDNKLTWSQHIFEVKENFVNKLNLLKRISFLPRYVLLDVYFKIILPSVYPMRCRYGEVLPKKMGSLPWNHYTVELLSEYTRPYARYAYCRNIEDSPWDSLHFMYKVNLAPLAYKISYDCTPPSMGHILTKKTSPMHYLLTKNKVKVPRLTYIS